MRARYAPTMTADRPRRRPDGARRPPRRDGAHAGRAAAARAGRRPARAARARGRRPARRRATSPIEPGFGPTTTRGPRTAAAIIDVPAARSATSWRRRSADDRPARPARLLVARRRLHGPRRRARRAAARRDRVSGSALAWFDAHGDFNTPDTTPSGNVWGMPFAMICGRGDPDLVARPATARRSTRRTPRCSAGRSSTRPSRGCSRRRASRTSGPGCSRPMPGWRPSTAGHDGRRRGSTAITSPSTWTASMPPGAGRSRCPNRTASRSRRRSPRSTVLARGDARWSGSARPG